MTKTSADLRFIDAFCGIGGFRLALEEVARELKIKSRCVFSCDIDDACARAYAENFGDVPSGDITQTDSVDIEGHDLLLAGFPCQPFSIIGERQGFLDSTRGTLFFEIARILRDKRPRAFVLENVKQLVRHDKGKTMDVIVSTLKEIGYSCEYRILNAMDFGLPQKRERVFIVGFLGPAQFEWPEGKVPMTPLSEVLEPEEDVPEKFWASEYIRQKRYETHKSRHYPAIWHENKSGNISSHPFSCALRANASYNYLLVNGERRLTPRECLRLQGFPDSYRIVCTDEQTRKQAGNALPIPVARAVLVPVVKQIVTQKKKRSRSLSQVEKTPKRQLTKGM